MYGTTILVCVVAVLTVAIVEGKPAVSNVPADGKCIPGKSYKVDCNTCVCGQNGALACTLALCLNKRSASDDDLGGTCTPGDHKTIGNGCNYCSCTNKKQWACIDGNIANCDTGSPKTKRASECIEGQSKQIDCNSCHCTKNGNWACTRRACLSPEDAAFLKANNPALSGEKGGIYRV